MKVMMTIHAATPPELEDVKQRFGLSDADVDQAFGVVEIDPEDQLFAFMIEEKKAEEVTDSDWDVKGPYSNPRIAPFGPPQ